MSALTNCGLHRGAVHHSVTTGSFKATDVSACSVSFPAVHCSCKLSPFSHQMCVCGFLNCVNCNLAWEDFLHLTTDEVDAELLAWF